MIKLRNALFAALGIVVLNTVLVLYSTKTGHAGNPVPVVQVTGTTSTEEVNNPDLQPVGFSMMPVTNETDSDDTFVVPAGKRLVIDYVSSQLDNAPTGPNSLTLEVKTNGTTLFYELFANKSDLGSVATPVKIYADPGSTVTSILSANVSSTVSAFMTVTGHYVND